MLKGLWLSHGEHEATEPFQAPEGTHKAVREPFQNLLRISALSP